MSENRAGSCAESKSLALPQGSEASQGQVSDIDTRVGVTVRVAVRVKSGLDRFRVVIDIDKSHEHDWGPHVVHVGG